MKIAIHNINKNKHSFTPYWIKYCVENSIDYKLVNCYENDFFNKVSSCDVLLWHHIHNDPKEVLFAKSILYALEHLNIKTFPDFKTAWHFDNKIAQKYLLEKIEAPFVKSYVFFDKSDALDWACSTDFPKVFKLKGGAGSSNVKLIKSISQAKKIIKKSFDKGFYLEDNWHKLKSIFNNKIDFKTLPKNFVFSLYRGFFKKNKLNSNFKEKDYVYFQDFIPNNSFDVRVIIISKKAFAIKRHVLKGDFRASGSGLISYNKDEIDERCIKIAFEISDSLSFKCMSYDFVFDNNNRPLIVEMSYGFNPPVYKPCNGYWDFNMNWIPESFNPYGWMIEDILNN